MVIIKSDKEISHIELRSFNGSLVAESKKPDYINVAGCPTGYISFDRFLTIDRDISTVKLIKN